LGFVGVLRELWRFRVPVLAAALFALVVGVLLMFRVSVPGGIESRRYDVGLASTTALVDTPSSQVADLGDTGADVGTLSVRASLLASLMTSSPIKDQIAARAGLPADTLIAIPPSGTGPGAAPPPNVPGTEKPGAIILRASVPTLESGEVPIISVATQAPDAARAARLADQAVAVLREHLESVAGVGKVPAGRRVVVRQLGPARGSLVRRGPGPALAIVASIFVFGLGCAAVLGLSWLVRVWRAGPAVEEDGRPTGLVDWDQFGDDDREDAQLMDASSLRRP
jgi:hypothetical protein